MRYAVFSLSLFVILHLALPVESSVQARLQGDTAEMLAGAPYTGRISIYDDAGASFATKSRWTPLDNSYTFTVITPSGENVEISGAALGVTVSWASPLRVKVVPAGTTLCIPVCLAILNDQPIFDDVGAYRIVVRVNVDDDIAICVAEDSVRVVEAGAGYEAFRDVLRRYGAVLYTAHKLRMHDFHVCDEEFALLGKDSSYKDAYARLLAYQTGGSYVVPFATWLRYPSGPTVPFSEKTNLLEAELERGLAAAKRARANIDFWVDMKEAYDTWRATQAAPGVGRRMWVF